MTETERDCRTAIVAAYCWYYAKAHNTVYMCAPFWRYARALGLLS